MNVKVRDDMLPIVAVNAVIFELDGRVLLTRRADNGLWCLPGGLVEFGETVEEAVVREVLEETGLRCTVEALVGVYSSNNIKVSQTARRCSIILAFRLSTQQSNPQTSDEVCEVGYFHVDRLPDDIVENHGARIGDAAKRAPLPVIN